jgi:beta-glucosidase
VTSSASARVEDLLKSLNLEEKCSLTSGHDMWSTRRIERVGIPAVRLTDGPNGARGPVLAGEGTLTSACVPCGSALGATWDASMVEDVGRVVAEEALTKGCRVLLAPTVNLHRSPLAGRNFECYSEDPLLTGKMAAAFIRGAQSMGVACTVKHFVGNEAEFERGTISSEIDERTLRELYLTPFEIAVHESGVLGVMTAYNRLNGTWCAEHDVLRDILREEWGFDGVVVTDWGAVGSTGGSLAAGVDLEMPGPGAFFGERLLDAVRRRHLRAAAFDRLRVHRCAG